MHLLTSPKINPFSINVRESSSIEDNEFKSLDLMKSINCKLKPFFGCNTFNLN